MSTLRLRCGIGGAIRCIEASTQATASLKRRVAAGLRSTARDRDRWFDDGGRCNEPIEPSRTAS